MGEIENGLTSFERETHFNINADNRAECEIYTDDPVWFRRLAKWFDPVWTDGAAGRFVVPTRLIIREYAITAGSAALERLRDEKSG